MKIIMLISSRRKNGNTTRFITQIESELQKIGKIYETPMFFVRIQLSESNLKFCCGCRICFDKGEACCPRKDNLLEIRNKISEADGIILGSPVYVEDVNGIMKKRRYETMIIIIPLCILIGFLAWRLKPQKYETGSSHNALLATLLPSAVMAFTAVAFQLLHNASGVISVAEASNSLFVAGLIFIGVGIITLICFTLFRKKDIAKSIGFGLCMSFFITVVELGLLEWLGGV